MAVDALITQWSLHLSVPEVDALARALVRELNPKQPNGAHEQRFCHMSQDLNGNWAGRFACGQTQGALIKAAIAAFARPRPGLAVDEHGVQRELPDRRDLGQRQMDALADLVAIAAARAGVNLPGAAGPRPDSEPWPDHFGEPEPTDPAATDAAAEDAATDAATDAADRRRHRRRQPTPTPIGRRPPRRSGRRPPRRSGRRPGQPTWTPVSTSTPVSAPTSTLTSALTSTLTSALTATSARVPM